ncbi:hypothetical protein Tco_0107596, partial [Tanacetum coccineum]
MICNLLRFSKGVFVSLRCFRSESEGISDGVCDVPLCDNPTPLKAFKDHSEIVVNFNDDDTSSDNDDFEDIEYVSLEEKLLNINRLIANIESLNDNSTPNCVLKSTSPFPILDSNSFFEKSDTSLSYSNNSLPEFESFSDHTEETSSDSTTTHVDFSLPKYDSFIFDILISHFPPADRSDFYHEKFADELAHIISPPDLKCFYFKIEPDP